MGHSDGSQTRSTETSAGTEWLSGYLLILGVQCILKFAKF